MLKQRCHRWNKIQTLGLTFFFIFFIHFAVTYILFISFKCVITFIAETKCTWDTPWMNLFSTFKNILTLIFGFHLNPAPDFQGKIKAKAISENKNKRSFLPVYFFMHLSIHYILFFSLNVNEVCIHLWWDRSFSIVLWVLLYLYSRISVSSVITNSVVPVL